MTSLTMDEHRMQSDALDHLAQTVARELPEFSGALLRAKAALGVALIRERIGTAQRGEVQRARDALAATEGPLYDLQLITLELPGFRKKHAEIARDLNAKAAAGYLAQRVEVYKVQRRQFEDNLKDLAKDSYKLKRVADELYKCAQGARKVFDLRKYYKSVSRRPGCAFLARY